MKWIDLEWWKDLFFPYTCMGCDALVSQPEQFCDKCKENATYIRELPPIPQIHTAAAVYTYRVSSAGVLRRKREPGGVSLAAMAEEMEMAYHRFRFPLPDLVLSIPAHPIKTWYFMYDHGADLAQAVADRLNVPIGDKVLGKQKWTRPQHKLRDRAKRAKNLVDAFAVLRPAEVCGKVILLVDDVITTGHTLTACAEVLRHSGARDVYALSYAYTQK